VPQSKPKINAVIGSNNNLPINVLVQLDNQNVGGETVFLWQILDQPAGPLDVLSNPNIQNPTFTPKKEGTYLLKLTVNSVLASTIIAGIRELKSLERILAAGETVEDDAIDGWATAGDALLRKLLNRSADPAVLVGTAFDATCTYGTILHMTATAVIKTGLPGQETVPTFARASSNTVESQEDALFISMGGVDGNPSPAAGALIYAKLFGAFELGVSVAPTPIFINGAGGVSVTPGRFPRQIGNYISNTVFWFDGRMTGATLLDLLDSIGVAVSTVGSIRLRCLAGVLEVSQNGAAYVPVISGGAALANIVPVTLRGDGAYTVIADGIDVTEITQAGTISQVVLRRRVAGAAGTTEVDVLKNGVTIYTTPANRPKVLFSAGNNARVVATLPDTLALAAGDRLEMAIISAETGGRRDVALFIVRS